MTCPLLYRFRVIDRLPEPSSPVTTRGTLVHGVLERLFDSPALERTVERAHALLEPEWQRLLAERPELEALFRGTRHRRAIRRSTTRSPAWLASARVLIETYFALEDPTRVEPAQRELLVEAELPDGVRLRGFVDRVDVGRGGATRIVDYKTGSSPSELFEAKALFQLKFYALVMWRMSGTIPAHAAADVPGRQASACATPPTKPTCSPPSAKSERCGQRSNARLNSRTSRRARASCATGARTRHCAQHSAALPRRIRNRLMRPGPRASSRSITVAEADDITP